MLKGLGQQMVDSFIIMQSEFHWRIMPESEVVIKSVPVQHWLILELLGVPNIAVTSEYA